MPITFLIGQGYITCFDSFFRKWYEGPEGQGIPLQEVRHYFKEALSKLQVSDIRTDWEREMGRVMYALSSASSATVEVVRGIHGSRLQGLKDLAHFA